MGQDGGTPLSCPWRFADWLLSPGGGSVRWWQSQKRRPWDGEHGASHLRRWLWSYGRSVRCDSPDGLAALVAGCLGQLFGLLLQQFIQRFFHTAANLFLQLPLDNSSLNCTMLDMVCRLLSNVCVAASFYQRPASRVYLFAIFNLRNLLFLIGWNDRHLQ